MENTIKQLQIQEKLETELLDLALQLSKECKRIDLSKGGDEPGHFRENVATILAIYSRVRM